MTCSYQCKPESLSRLSRKGKDEASIFMIRLENNDVFYPPVNLYEDFAKACIHYRVIGEEGKLTRYVVSKNLEFVLQNREKDNNMNHPDDAFQLGLVFHEKGNYSQALKHLKSALLRFEDPRAKYLIGVMLFDNLLEDEDLAQYENPQKSAFYIMQGLLSLDRGVGSPLGNAEIVDASAFNLYLACLQGWGVKQSEDTALRYLQLAAAHGDTRVSVMAQTELGYFYSSDDHMDLSKAYQWHSEACQNGSLESQAVIGVFHMFGLSPVHKDWCTALNCLRDASERGSVYATGILAFLYFRRGLYTLASRTAYSLVANGQLHSALMLDERGRRNANNIKERDFVRRSLAVAYFIYATCLDQGLGVQRDREISREMYSKSIRIDPKAARRLQGMVILEEI